MDAELFPRSRTRIAPGAVHLPDWLTSERQRELLEACRDWARPPAGLRTVRTPGGGTMTSRQVCLGRHWYPYGYAATAVDGDGAPVKEFPAWLAELGRRAVRDAFGQDGSGSAPDGPRTPAHARRHAPRDGAPDEQPRPDRPGPGHDSDCDGYDDHHDDGYHHDDDYDIALINFYDADARMGMHRDSDEKSGAPVVSLSLGDTCVFRFGNTVSRGRPYTDVELRSGDLFVFGREARLAYHGVPRVHPGTGPPGLGLSGRLNITLRVSGLPAR